MLRRAVLLLAGLLPAACGSTSPAAPASSGTPALATSYVNEIVAVMQNNSINRASINWTDFNMQVTARAQGAQTIADTYPAISLALGLLNDHHSFYAAVTGATISNPSHLTCSAATVADASVPADIGYVRVGSFSGTDPASSTVFADSIQQQIRRADRAGLAGWIVDVRGNLGGNMWPMVAGVGPVLGDGIAGYFVPPGAAATPWSYQSGASMAGGTAVARTSAAYDLFQRSPRAAVLTDGAVASSGEAVVVSFRSRPNTRSFGSPTCGLSTANGTFRLSDGAMLYLTDATMADRTQTPYGTVIAPDETVSGDAEVVQRAIVWLRGGSTATLARH